MTKIKICGIFRDEDAEYINRYRPDYFGMVIDFAPSHRSIDKERAKRLRSLIALDIPAAGVFVDKDIEEIAVLLKEGIIDIAQLHGNETEDHIKELQKKTKKPVWKAFKIESEKDVAEAQKSCADMVLLDSGRGTGKSFDWSLLREIKRPFILAGGLDINNLEEAIRCCKPEIVDISSGVESEKKKDGSKIREAIRIVREA